MKKPLIICALALFFTACSSGEAPSAKAAPPSGKINLDVANVTVVDNSTPPTADSPTVKNNFTPAIQTSVRQWLTQHLAGVGATGGATVALREASLREEALPYTSDMFTRKQASKYVAHV